MKPNTLINLSLKKFLNLFLNLLLILNFFFLFSFESCKKNPVSPPINNGADTTSHNYAWQTFILGDGNSSILYDAAIINDTLIYAVGEIYVKDSTGQDYIDFNAAVWNGQKWNLQKIPTEMYGDYIGVFPITTILALNSGSIYTFSNAGSYSYWDGVSWITHFVSERSGGGQKLWGSDMSNIFLVGTNGSLSYYNGTWQRIDLGTTANIFDVWGTVDNKTGVSTVYVPVSDLNNDNGIKKIFKLKGTQVDSLQWNTGKNVLSIWGTPDGKTLYAAGDGLFVNKGSGWSEIPFGKDKRFIEVRGDASNNIFARGIYLVPPLNELVVHYNGSTWYEYKELSNFINFGLAVQGKTTIIVGTTGNQAVAVIGKRID